MDTKERSAGAQYQAEYKTRLRKEEKCKTLKR
jgi:hypothetical protein